MSLPGFLFRAQPTLMTLDSSATIMDAIFASAEEEGRGRLLKIMQEFLVSEASKYSAKEKGMFIPFRLFRFAQSFPRKCKRDREV